MQFYINPPSEQWQQLTVRNIPDDPAVDEAVKAIIEDVRVNGDTALRTMACKFDHTEISDFEVSEAEIAEACSKVSDAVKAAIGLAKENITKFHAAQRPAEVDVQTLPGVRCVQRPVAIDRVGLYIPGGQAPLFSTVLMLACPAKIAGCREIVLCTPQSHNKPIAPEILYTASICGIDKIYRIGGAQAIAAMALGTESIAKVDKIFGPGNRLETRPANRGCSTEDIARKVNDEVERLSSKLSRAESVEASLSHSRLIVIDDEQRMIDFVNAYAPEHLIISMREPWRIADRIRAAGSVFIGNFSPESAGDYASGTNHTLPTGAWARAYSGVNLDSFMRKITYQELSREGLALLAPTITTMAEAEGLDAHALAVDIRTPGHL